VAWNADLRSLIPADLGRVRVEVDQARGSGERATGEVEEASEDARACRQHDVDAVQDCPLQAYGGRQHSAKERVSSREIDLGPLGDVDGRSEHFGEPDGAVDRPRLRDTVPEQERAGRSARER